MMSLIICMSFYSSGTGFFPEYQGNPFYAFGESYAGKFVPAITKRIHEQNSGGHDVIPINIGGMGIGDGWMSPYHNARYANFLYYVSLLDENQRDECLVIPINIGGMGIGDGWMSPY